MIETVLKMGLSLAGVLALILLLSFLARKRKYSGSKLMSVVAYQPFGSKRGVAALRVGGEVLLLGVTQAEFRLLKTFDEKVLIPGPCVPAESPGRSMALKDVNDG